MERVLEPEVMDTWEDVVEYDSMDFTEVNQAFAEKALEIGSKTGLILDVGTGTARIPIIICQQRPELEIIGIDLSKNMLVRGDNHVESAALQARIKLELVDAKKLPYSDNYFDGVISNTIIHHLPDPMPFFREMKRVLKPGGSIFLRDLLRPMDEATVDGFVDKYEADANEYQRKLFRDSLKAAFTLDEVMEMLKAAGLEGVQVYQSSDRHWTAEREWK